MPLNYDLKALQRKILEILLAFDKVAREHHLRYTISYGSMLGAVRHGGFIPWDDDLDISMPRPDYERLILHAKEWLPQPYELVCAENDPAYPLPFAKIQDASTTLIERPHYYYLGGCYIDVFPIDAVPTNPLKRRWRFARAEYYKQCIYLCHRDPYRHGRGPSSWLPLLVRKVHSMAGLQRALKRLLTKDLYDEAALIACYTEDHLSQVMPREVGGEFAPVNFEGHEVSGIRNHDPYLTTLYGDYMQVPPPEQRHQHRFYYLDLNAPYKSYNKQKTNT